MIVVEQGRTPAAVDADDRERLLALYGVPENPWLRLNLVGTVDGSAVGDDGTSETITSRLDRRILGVIRELSDVVLVGAASVRAEGYQLPRRAPLAIVTRTGDLGGHRLDDPTRVVVLGPPAARSRAATTLADAPFLEVGEDAASIVHALRAHGYDQIVCEGGPTLAATLLGADLVDECCFTTSPLIGGALLPLLPGPLPRRELRPILHIVDESGSVFARWRVEPGG